MGNEGSVRVAPGYDDFFQEFMNASGVGQAAVAGQQQRSSGPPPVSDKYLIKYLKPINITIEDLLEETNKECCFCLGEQVVGDLASKLPCGHLFHASCVEPWLKLHCTCPVCRYELETSDAAYERSRKNRMKERKQRYRLDELSKKSIPVLKEIMSTYSISTAGCIDKIDLVDRLVSSGKIEIVEGLPVIEYTTEELDGKTKDDMLELCASFGIAVHSGAVKSDLIEILKQAGRITEVSDVVESKAQHENFEQQENCEEPSTKSDAVKTHSSSINEVPSTLSNDETYEQSKKINVYDVSGDERSDQLNQYLQSKSIGELKNLLQSLGVSTIGALEKNELIMRYMKSGYALPDMQPSINPAVFDASVNSKSDEPDVSTQNRHDSCGTFDAQYLFSMSVKELKGLSSALDVNLRGCLDKSDIVQALINSGKLS